MPSNAAHIFRQLMEAETDTEKRQFYDALARMALNIEEMANKMDSMERALQTISYRAR